MKTNSNPYIKQSNHEEITTLILGDNANVHTITKKDRFLDNGICIQLIKEIPMKVRFAGDSLVLGDDSLKKIQRFQKIIHRDNEFNQMYPDFPCEVFSIVKSDERFLIMAYENEQDVENKKGFFLGGEGYYSNALKIKEEQLPNYYAVKIFDTDKEELTY